MSTGPGTRLTRWFLANSASVLLAFVGLVGVVLLGLAALPYYGPALGVSAGGVRTVGLVAAALAGLVLALLAVFLTLR